MGRLNTAEIPKDAVNAKLKPKYYDVVEVSLDETEIGSFDTLLRGRHGLGKARKLLLGSVTNKVVQKAKGCAINVVE